MSQLICWPISAYHKYVGIGQYNCKVGPYYFTKERLTIDLPILQSELEPVILRRKHN